jgi:predicted TIM-barrel fold metal-dependent hydrolase
VCISTMDLGLKHSEAFPFMSRVFATTNDQLAEALAELASPKLIPFCYIDPRKKDAPRDLERRVTKQGFCGADMHPPIGWYPDEPRVRPTFEAAEALGVPVFLHLGRTAAHPQLRSKYAQPLYLEGLGVACPGLKLILGHFAAPWSREACRIGAGFPNWRFDLATSGSSDRGAVLHCLRDPDLGVGRMLLGTNGNGANNLRLAAATMDRLREYGFTDRELDAVSHDNAAAFFGVL